jgi:hypothetical protein
MTSSTSQDIEIAGSLVKLRCARIDLPGTQGWIGAWEVYQLPWYTKKKPACIGETDVQVSECLAFGMAKAIATELARIL